MKNYKISEIYLYQGNGTSIIDINKIANYLEDKLGCNVKNNGDFLDNFINIENNEDLLNVSKKIASTKVENLKDLNDNPMYGEVEFEKRRILGKTHAFGIMYDGFKLMNIFQKLLPKHKQSWEMCHIILTNRLIGTFDKDDLRYHARVIVCGYPSIISTVGLVEAPAKPRDYYILKRSGVLDNEIKVEQLKEKLKDKVLTHDDNRSTEVLKGYFMQAIYFQNFLENPFCKNKNCRLFNSHWQEEVINAQLTLPEFCNKHEKMFKELKESMIEDRGHQ